MRVAHISDHHFPTHSAAVWDARDALVDLKYDLLAVTGDYGRSPRLWPAARTQLEAFFRPLRGRAPIVGVLGNHDDPSWSTDADFPIKLLNNESIQIRRSDTTITVAGVNQSTPGAEDLQRALAHSPSADVVILMAHFPSTAFRVDPGAAHVILSGHTHGGQIRLPWLGCLWTNDRIPRSQAQGWHRLGNCLVHVNPGLGVSGPLRFRVNCPPEISLVTLTAWPYDGPNSPAKPADNILVGTL